LPIFDNYAHIGKIAAMVKHSKQTHGIGRRGFILRIYSKAKRAKNALKCDLKRALARFNAGEAPSFTHKLALKRVLKVVIRYLTACNRGIHDCTMNCDKVRVIFEHNKKCFKLNCEVCRRRNIIFNAHMSTCTATGYCRLCNEYENVINAHQERCKNTSGRYICKVCRVRKSMQREHCKKCINACNFLCKVPYCMEFKKKYEFECS